MNNKSFFIPGRKIRLLEGNHGDLNPGDIVTVIGCAGVSFEAGHVMSFDGRIITGCQWRFWEYADIKLQWEFVECKLP